MTLKRLGIWVVNLVLVCVSIKAAFLILGAADRAVERWMTPRLWPGSHGILFIPGSENSYETCDFTCTERINSLGFRDREVSVQKTCSYRILAIGDSFTYGWGVNLEDTWCKRLERNLREQGLDVEVLNLGKPAAGPQEYASIAQTAIPILHPDMVLVGMLMGDDLQQALGDLKRLPVVLFPNLAQLARRLTADTGQAAQNSPPNQSAKECRENWARVAAELLSGMGAEQRARFEKIEEPIRKAFLDGRMNPWMLGHTTGSPDYFMDSLDPDTMKVNTGAMTRALKRIRKVSDRYGCRVVVLSIPEGLYVNTEAQKNVLRIGFRSVPEMLETDAPDEAIRRACSRAGLTFHTVMDGFREHIDETGLYLEVDRHFTPKGNALYGDLITPLVAGEIGNAARPSAARQPGGIR